MDYIPFDYGPEINQWRTPTEEMPVEYNDPEFRLKKYNQLVDDWSSLLAKECNTPEICEMLKISEIKQKYIPRKQIMQYILELIPPQDLFEFAQTDKIPLLLPFEAAEKYDPDCYYPALKLLEQPSVPNPKLNEIESLMDLN